MEDVLYGKVKLSRLARELVATPEFQRLKHIGNLGTVVVHNPTRGWIPRFDHVVGTYYLTRLALEYLQHHQPELLLTDRVIDICAVAGLVHDLGHVSLSHFFDHVLLPVLEQSFAHSGEEETVVKQGFQKIKDLKRDQHEERSIELLGAVVAKYGLKITKDEQLFIAELIRGVAPNQVQSILGGKYSFTLDLINNNTSSLDMDKLDYVRRDSHHLGLDYMPMKMVHTLFSGLRVLDGKIHFSKDTLPLVTAILSQRFYLHQQVYQCDETLRSDAFLAHELASRLSIHWFLDGMTHPDLKWAKWTDADFLVFKSKTEMMDRFHGVESRSVLVVVLKEEEGKNPSKVEYDVKTKIHTRTVHLEHSPCRNRHLLISFPCHIFSEKTRPDDEFYKTHLTSQSWIFTTQLLPKSTT